MTEDREFNAFLKSRLEEGAEPSASLVRALERLAVDQVRRRKRLMRVRFGGAALLAASFFLVVALNMTVWRQPPVVGGFDEAIALLCEMDGIDGESLPSSSSGELLVSWQDAPCVNLL